MKRKIVTYEKLTKDILDLLVTKYPDGYDYKDIISYRNSKGENIKAVEVRAEDTIYLVKISQRLEQTMEDYAEDEDSFSDDDFLDKEFDEKFLID
ncbi:MAG: hypothetical protein CR985_03920 [Flavobacteriales bacterium]|nr:MAG: hypothetical protein CR985_03920 [Flavobacteriales bacterium]